MIMALIAGPLSGLQPILRRHAGLFWALLVYLGLALSYFFIVPIFEGPDEWTHTGHVKYIAAGHGLPVMLPGQGIWGGQQPPLYYALGALLVQPFELEAFDGYEEAHKNPHASLGYALDPGNKNNYLHLPTEDFPYCGLALAVHGLRLYSMAFGVVALIFTYLAALELSPAGSRPVPGGSGWPGESNVWFATSVALFVACQPMFTFITASVANEPANMAFCAAGVWLVGRYVLFGPDWKWAIALGVTLGLISLSKMTGLSLGLVAVAAFLMVAIGRRKEPGVAGLLWRDGLLVALFFLAVGGWWYWRNYQLYGDFFQEGLYKRYFNVDPQPLTLGEFLYTLSTGEVSFWATFGWLNIVAPEWVYTAYWVISRLGLLGVVFGLAKVQISAKAPEHSFTRLLLLHLLFPVALAFSLTRLVAIEGGMQGRQLLPALGSIAVVVMGGWWWLLPERLRRPGVMLLNGALLALAVWLPYGVVRPAYVPPPLLAAADLPPDLVRLDWTYQKEMKLIGVEIGREVVHPGERVPVTAYWQAVGPVTKNYSVFVHLSGRNYQNVGQFNSYPGLGLRPTTTLAPGQIVADTYPVLVEGGSEAPTRLLVNLGLFDFEEAGRPGLPALTPNGTPASSTVGQLKLTPTAWPAAGDTPPVADFGDSLTLAEYALEDCDAGVCVLTLTWVARGKPSADYTVFIHLWRDGAQVVGFDAPPLAGDYPTSLWEAGEVIHDPHPFNLATLAPGEYRILVGLYHPVTGERLPAQIGGVVVVEDGAVEVGAVNKKR
jgi:4-amino-4-deoxy-L-arabinose transferase-like glycosyltransferase